MARETQLHGIPLWLLREYLEDLGGVSESDILLNGPGWQAHLRQLPPVEIGSLRVGRVEVELHGSQEALDTLRPLLHSKTMRAGA
jgi:molybdopterin synthase sulfur carrier subunit